MVFFDSNRAPKESRIIIRRPPIPLEMGVDREDPSPHRGVAWLTGKVRLLCDSMFNLLDIVALGAGVMVSGHPQSSPVLS